MGFLREAFRELKIITKKAMVIEKISVRMKSKRLMEIA